MMTITLISILTLMLLCGNGCIEKINSFTSEPPPSSLVVLPSNRHRRHYHRHHHYSRHFGSQSSSSSSSTTSYSSSTLFATCRICRCTYNQNLLFNDNDNDNNDNDELLSLMCVYHPGSLRGESPRKSDWEDDDDDVNVDMDDDDDNVDEIKSRSITRRRQRKSIDNSKLVYTYTCCGGSKESLGCRRGRHKSYDDP